MHLKKSDQTFWASCLYGMWLNTFGVWHPNESVVWQVCVKWLSSTTAILLLWQLLWAPLSFTCKSSLFSHYCASSQKGVLVRTDFRLWVFQQFFIPFYFIQCFCHMLISFIYFETDLFDFFPFKLLCIPVKTKSTLEQSCLKLWLLWCGYVTTHLYQDKGHVQEKMQPRNYKFTFFKINLWHDLFYLSETDWNVRLHVYRAIGELRWRGKCERRNSGCKNGKGEEEGWDETRSPGGRWVRVRYRKGLSPCE